MKRLLTLISFILLIPCSISATTVTASVGGTLKVYETIVLSVSATIIFPAQFEGPLQSDLINVNGAAPSTGIPNIVGDTQGRAGKLRVYGTAGTIFAASIVPSMSLVNGGSTITAALSLWANSDFTGAVPTTIGGTVGTLGQYRNIWVKGLISSGTNLVAGTYIGTALWNVTYN